MANDQDANLKEDHYVQRKQNRHLQETIRALRGELEGAQITAEVLAQQHKTDVHKEIAQLKLTVQALRDQLQITGIEKEEAVQAELEVAAGPGCHVLRHEGVFRLAVGDVAQQFQNVDVTVVVERDGVMIQAVQRVDLREAAVWGTPMKFIVTTLFALALAGPSPVQQPVEADHSSRFNPRSSEGVFDIHMRVDGEVFLYVKGSEISHLIVSGAPLRLER